MKWTILWRYEMCPSIGKYVGTNIIYWCDRLISKCTEQPSTNEICQQQFTECIDLLTYPNGLPNQSKIHLRHAYLYFIVDRKKEVFQFAECVRLMYVSIEICNHITYRQFVWLFLCVVCSVYSYRVCTTKTQTECQYCIKINIYTRYVCFRFNYYLIIIYLFVSCRST